MTVGNGVGCDIRVDAGWIDPRAPTLKASTSPLKLSHSRIFPFTRFSSKQNSEHCLDASARPSVFSGPGKLGWTN